MSRASGANDASRTRRATGTSRANDASRTRSATGASGAAEASDVSGATGRGVDPAVTQADAGGTVEELRTALYQLFAAERRLRSRDQSRPGELTHAQMRSIIALGSEREMTAGQLAKSAELTPGSVTAILDQLEAAGIVERRRSTEDRRVCYIALTPEGWKLRERKLSAWKSLWEERLSRFSDEQLQSAAEIVHEMSAVFDTVANATAPPTSSA
jgi:MarR family transcriptional regulator, organic hydroperoxide resistance regulator